MLFYAAFDMEKHLILSNMDLLRSIGIVEKTIGCVKIKIENNRQPKYCRQKENERADIIVI